MARSKVADELQQADAAAIAAMSPAERLELAFELGRRGVEMYMTAHNVDRETAARALKRASQAGRRYSRCMDDDQWPADFRAAERHALEASLAATPSQRLAWLEEALAFAYKMGALPARDSKTKGQ